MRNQYLPQDRFNHFILLAILTLILSLLVSGIIGYVVALRAPTPTPTPTHTLTPTPPSSFQPIVFQLPEGYKVLNQHELGTALAIDLEVPTDSRVSQGLPILREMVVTAGRTLRVTIFIQTDAETQAQIGFQPDERLGDYMFYLFVQEPKPK